MNLSSEDVQDILRLLDTLPFDEAELETSRFLLKLRRAGDGVWAQDLQVRGRADGQETAAAAPGAARPPVARAAAEPSAEGPGAGADGAADDGQQAVRAPLMGTFYRAPQPGAAPFVEAGTVVGPETVVAIIETMKLMNPVYAGLSGTVTQIGVADGQFVEQGAALMLVRTAAE